MTSTVSNPSAIASSAPVALSEVVDRLLAFEGTPQQFLAELMAVICDAGGARSATLLRRQRGQSTGILAVHPPPGQPTAQAPTWITRLVTALDNGELDQALEARQPLDLPAPSPSALVILVPLRPVAGGAIPLVAALVELRDYQTMTATRWRLALLAGLASLFDVRAGLQQRAAALDRMRQAMEVLAALNEHPRFTAAAMALCNTVAANWSAQRVGLGFLRGRYVKLRALSHTEKFTRKTRLAQDIESAMEECLDQDEEVLHPSPAGATVVSRAAGELSARHGPTCVLSLPLRREGKVVGVLTVERAPDEPMSVEEVQALRLACDLCTGPLVTLRDHDRWIGAQVASSARSGLAALVGPRHTWAKALVALGLALVLFLTFGRGEYRVEAPFVLQDVERRVVPAPFAGYLQSVEVEPDDPVTAGVTVLATLDTSELRLRLAAAEAERASHLKSADKAMQENKTAEMQIALAEAQRVEAQVRLLSHQLSKASIVAPITGVVTAGDLKRRIGAPVQVGDTLFEIAPLGALRAELAVSEHDIADVAVGQTGQLATAADAVTYIRFEVEHVNPVAEVVDRRNIFRVRARLLDAPAVTLRPGAAGIAKIDLGQRSYLRLWTMDLERWIRMKLWI